MRHTRRSLIAASASLPLISCANLPVRNEKAELKVATFNIWHNLGDWPARQPLLVNAIRAQDADVIALQEVLEDADLGLENQAQMLARELGGYHVAFVSTDPPEAPRRYGNALLSRLPVIEQDSVKLEPLGDFRTALRLRVAVDGRPIDVAVTHLAWQDDAAPIRARQIAHLLEWLPRSGAPLVLMGDFNAEQDDEGLAALTGPQFISALPRGQAATTLNPAKGHPERVIDHIFVELSAFAPVRSHIFGDQPIEGEYPSDHFGVAATLKLI